MVVKPFRKTDMGFSKIVQKRREIFIQGLFLIKKGDAASGIPFFFKYPPKYSTLDLDLV
jgi:hypothetical protein